MRTGQGSSENRQMTSVAEVNGCIFPVDRYYDLDHDIWLKPSEDKILVGITSILQAITGKLTSVRPKPINFDVACGRSICTIESSKYVGAVRSPISGRLVEANQTLVESPTLANIDPYGDGWIVKMRSEDDLDQVDGVMSGTDAIDHLRRRVEEKRLLCFKFVPDAMVNAIGLLCPGPVTKLAEEIMVAEVGSIIHLVADDPAVVADVNSWTRIKGEELLESRKQENIYHFLVRRTK